MNINFTTSIMNDNKRHFTRTKAATALAIAFPVFAPLVATACPIAKELPFTLPMYNVEFRVIEADATDYVRIADAHKNGDGIVTNYNAVLLELSACENTDLVDAASVLTIDDAEATMKDVTEYSYPTAYDIRITEGTNNVPGALVAVEPQDFQMREVGIILKVQIDTNSGKTRPYVSAIPQIVGKPEWKDYGNVYTDAKGKKLRYRAEQPFFSAYTYYVNAVINPGEKTILLGSRSRQHIEIVDTRTPILWRISRIFGTKAEIKKERITLAFLTVTPASPAQPETDDEQTKATKDAQPDSNPFAK